eukprot:TRINITY_DN9956_c0_g1_i2.p1 TRINITY_DN9956_c0_g1~~TRINITY_DN9956_c0_g1_i2.p1  ORF type:complete len:288 (+),score=38.30 TRINITY_DN9956_c0_g1_i2:369-1232(+)
MNGYVSMTTKDYTQKQMEEIYCEVLVSGLPEDVPQIVVGKLAEEHGPVESVHIEERSGMASISFKQGQDAEQFWLACNNASPPSGTAGKGEPMMVEFLWYLPEQNPHLYDDLFGSKATRQLLRAVPRKQPFCKKVVASMGKTDREQLFTHFKSYVKQIRQSSDHKETMTALRNKSISADVMVMRNWLLYKYNDVSYLHKARRLLEIANQDLSSAMNLIEYSHIDAVIKPQPMAPKGMLAQRSLLDVLFYFFFLASKYCTVHTVLITMLSAVTLLLLGCVVSQQYTIE